MNEVRVNMPGTSDRAWNPKMGSKRASFQIWKNSENEIIVAIHIFRFPCRRDHHVVSDMGVLVNDSSLDDATRSAAAAGPAGGGDLQPGKNPLPSGTHYG